MKRPLTPGQALPCFEFPFPVLNFLLKFHNYWFILINSPAFAHLWSRALFAWNFIFQELRFSIQILPTINCQKSWFPIENLWITECCWKSLLAAQFSFLLRSLPCWIIWCEIGMPSSYPVYRCFDACQRCHLGTWRTRCGSC